MKSYILLFFVLLVSICSCKKTVLNINNKQDKGVFSPTLKKEILRMIEVKNKEEHNGVTQLKVCNVVISQDINRDSICSVLITLSPTILKKTAKFIPPSDSLNIQNNSESEIIGYTFIENELIICYLFSDSCSNKLVNKNELYPIQDSIPGYPDILTIYDSEFPPTRIYEIVNEDSLRLIESIK